MHSLFRRSDECSTVLPCDVKVPVFKIFLSNGGQKEYDTVKNYFYQAKDNAERKHVLLTLSSIRVDPKLKVATMDWTTSGEVKLQDFFLCHGQRRSWWQGGRTGSFVAVLSRSSRTDQKRMLSGASPPT